MYRKHFVFVVHYLKDVRSTYSTLAPCDHVTQIIV
jgi:hypothetical protein